MILKLSICGLLIVLVIVLTLSYYFNQEGFNSPLPSLNPAILPTGRDYQVLKCTAKDVPGGNGVGSVYEYRMPTNKVTLTTRSPTVEIVDCSSLVLDTANTCNTIADSVKVSEVPLACLQKEFLNMGCKAEGNNYPKDRTTSFANDTKYSNFGDLKAKLAINKLKPMTDADKMDCLGTASNAGTGAGGTGGASGSGGAAGTAGTGAASGTGAAGTGGAGGEPVSILVPRGPPGPRGPRGPRGPPGPAAGSDLSKGSSLVPASGSGPAAYDTLDSPEANLASSAATPQRTDLQPENTLSDTAQTAMASQGKSDFLKSIQKIIRNELLASRSTDSDMLGASDGSCNGTDAIQQGQDYMSAKSDMSKYIKKDSIPCYGCALDY